jgi:hypothetical protein
VLVGPVKADRSAPIEVAERQRAALFFPAILRKQLEDSYFAPVGDGVEMAGRGLHERPRIRKMPRAQIVV